MVIFIFENKVVFLMKAFGGIVGHFPTMSGGEEILLK